MDMKDITDKEIQFNIMLALMKIAGDVSELLERNTEVDYSPLEEVNADDATRNIQ